MVMATRIDRLLNDAVKTGRVAGVVALAASEQGVIYEGAFGLWRIDADRAMSLDSVFWIASMTKAITATAAMQLVEQGRLELDAPASAIVPDLATPQVLEGFGADGLNGIEPAGKAGRPIRQIH